MTPSFLVTWIVRNKESRFANETFFHVTKESWHEDVISHMCYEKRVSLQKSKLGSLWVHACVYKCRAIAVLHTEYLVWMYVCMYVCMYVDMYTCMNVCMHVCRYVCVWMYVCMYAGMYVYESMYACMQVCMCMNVCMEVCMYVPDSRFANQREFEVLAAAQHVFLWMSHSSHVTNEPCHERVIARTSHSTNESCHEGVMSRRSHVTNESCHRGFVSRTSHVAHVSRRESVILVAARGGGLGSRPKKMYWEYSGDGVEYHLMSPTPRR